MSTCENKFSIGDDYGDNSCTFTCQLPEGHEGEHRERTEREGIGQVFVMTWNIGNAEVGAAAEAEALQERIRMVPLGWQTLHDDDVDQEYMRVYTTEVPNWGSFWEDDQGGSYWTFTIDREDGNSVYETGLESGKTIKEVMTILDDLARANGLIE